MFMKGHNLHRTIIRVLLSAALLAILPPIVPVHANGLPLPPPPTGLWPDPRIDSFAAAHPWLGVKVGVVQPGPNGGDFQDFLNVNTGLRSSVYDNSGQVHEVHGLILVEYCKVAGPWGSLGYPITDETGTPDGVGRYNHFQDGAIYWKLDTGAHEVHGPIYDEWAKLKWERGVLGYPITDEEVAQEQILQVGMGRTLWYNNFQYGTIYWTPATGAHVLEESSGGGGILRLKPA
jgi:hypothetical protein